MVNLSWRKHEQQMRSNDSALAEKAGDAFIAERELQTKTSQQARSWEEGRRNELIKNKPEYVKKRNQVNKDPSHKTLERLRNMGSFENQVIPSPGFVLIDVDPVEIKNPLGYTLPQNKDDAPNTGVVMEIGAALIAGNGDKIEFPFAKDDRVIFQKYAPNLHVNIKGHKYFFMQFNMILGKLV